MPNITFTASSGLNDSIYGKSQAPIRMFLEKRAEAFEQASMLSKLFAQEKSTHFGEKFTSMTAMDGFLPVGENGGYPVDGMQEGYSKFLEHMTWKNSFSLSREIVEDSKLFDLKKKAQPVHHLLLPDARALRRGHLRLGAEQRVHHRLRRQDLRDDLRGRQGAFRIGSSVQNGQG